MKSIFNPGTEVEIHTADGNVFEGILMNRGNDHVSAIGKLGIIHTFPVKVISEIKKL